MEYEKLVTVRYRNYRGEIGLRRILPKQILFGATEWHPEPQWLLEAFDLDKEADRSFAIRDVLEWNPSVHGSESDPKARPSLIPPTLRS